MLRSKIFATVPKIRNDPQYLSHFIHELMSFDISLKEDWNYDGGNGSEGWKGLTWEVLVKQDWFSQWLVVERDCEFFICRPDRRLILINLQSPWLGIRQ